MNFFALRGGFLFYESTYLKYVFRRNVNQADSTGSYSVETEKLDHRDVGTSSQGNAYFV